jgi:hypothetical protein
LGGNWVIVGMLSVMRIVKFLDKLEVVRILPQTCSSFHNAAAILHTTLPHYGLTRTADVEL